MAKKTPPHLHPKMIANRFGPGGVRGAQAVTPKGKAAIAQKRQAAKAPPAMPMGAPAMPMQAPGMVARAFGRGR